MEQNQTDAIQPYRWMVLALTSACFLFTFIVRFTWPPLIPVVVPILKMNMSDAGAFMSAFYLGYVITQIPAGILGDRFGVRLLLGGSLVLEGITTYAMGSIDTYATGFALRVATGLGAGAVYAAASRALMEWFPPKERGTAFGVLLCAPSAGILVSSMSVPPLNTAFGWDSVFKIVGVATMLVGVVVYLLLRASQQTKTAGGMFDGFKVVFRNKDILLTALAGFFLMWVELGTATWTFAHIKKLGFSLGMAGTVMTFYGLGGLLGPFVSGWLSDRIGHRKQLLMISLLIIAPVTVIFGSQTTITALSIWGFVFGFTSYVANPHLTILISEFAGKQYAATANGTSNFFFQMASMIGPWILGWSLDLSGNFAVVWWLMAAGPVLGALLLIPVNPANVAD